MKQKGDVRNEGLAHAVRASSRPSRARSKAFGASAELRAPVWEAPPAALARPVFRVRTSATNELACYTIVASRHAPPVVAVPSVVPTNIPPTPAHQLTLLPTRRSRPRPFSPRRRCPASARSRSPGRLSSHPRFRATPRTTSPHHGDGFRRARLTKQGLRR